MKMMIYLALGCTALAPMAWAEGGTADDIWRYSQQGQDATANGEGANRTMPYPDSEVNWLDRGRHDPSTGLSDAAAQTLAQELYAKAKETWVAKCSAVQPPRPIPAADSANQIFDNSAFLERCHRLARAKVKRHLLNLFNGYGDTPSILPFDRPLTGGMNPGVAHDPRTGGPMRPPALAPETQTYQHIEPNMPGGDAGY